jgi:hypothetical protein
MPNKYALCIGLSDQYRGKGFTTLPFAYKNVTDLSKKLTGKSYTVYPTLPEKEATKNALKSLLLEKISFLNNDDWFLFYYVGHGDIKYNPNSINNITTYLVTSFKDFDPSKGILNFLTDDDYAEIVKAFNDRASGGHLITILDCCYAFGLVDTFSQQKEFHTIIAGSTYNSKAFYDDNSFFFKALSTLLDKKISTITRDLEKTAKSLYAKSKCQCQLAENFKDSSL